MANVVTGVAISSLPSTDELDGSEVVPIVQDGVTKQTTLADVIEDLVSTEIPDGSITNAKLADMAGATIKGRALAAGTGPPQDLTAAQAGTVILSERAASSLNIGYMNVPPIDFSANVVLSATEESAALLLDGANEIFSATINGALGNGYVTTLVVLQDTSFALIFDADGDVIVNLANGDSGDFILRQGICTLWKANDSTWTIHGTNVNVIEQVDITITIGTDGADNYGFEYSNGAYEYGETDPAATEDPEGVSVCGVYITGAYSSEPAFSFFTLTAESPGALNALKTAFTSIQVEDAGGGNFVTLNMADATVAGTTMFWATGDIDWSALEGQDRILRFVP